MTDTDSSDWRTDRIRDLADRMVLEKLTREELEELAHGEDDPDTRDAAVVAIALLTIEMIAPLSGSKRLREFLKPDLHALFSKTENMIPIAGWWVGDKAAERRISDNCRSGAQYVHSAHRYAADGLDALEAGDFASARLYYELGKDMWTTALEKQIPTEGMKKLQAGAKPRGRRPATARDKALALAVEQQERLGKRGAAALNAAIKANPGLTKKSDGSEIKEPGMRKALRSGQKSLASK